MSFVKLDCGLLDSTLWIDREARELFITSLLMAEPVELKTPEPQIAVKTLEQTGFVVPVGWYGLVQAAGSGIVRRAFMDMETGMAALERLGNPDAGSRTPDFEGRRLVRVAGGYIVLNFTKYREKDHTAGERSRRYREKKLKMRRLRKSTKTGPLKGEEQTLTALESGQITQDQADEAAATTREY